MFTEPLGGWRRYRPELGALMRAELQRIAGTKGLSKNVYELAEKAARPANHGGYSTTKIP